MQEKTEIPDEELVKCILENDAHAFEILFDRYAKLLHQHVVCILHDEALAHDVVQETFVRVWTRGKQWRGLGPFKAWLYRIATNQALNLLRSVQRRREIPLVVQIDPDDEDDSINAMPAWMYEASSLGPEAVVIQMEERAHMIAQYQHTLSRLSEEKRWVFLMVHEMEMSLNDTADALNIPKGTVKSRLHYARKSLARAWREIEGGE